MKGLLIFIFCITHIMVSAQTKPAAKILQVPDSIKEARGNKLLDEAIIQMKSNNHSRVNSPVPTEIFKRDFLLKNPVSNLFESIQMVNGIQPTINCTVCNTGDFRINGMEGPYTLVLIDGMPIVSALSTVYGLSGIPNSMIERIEVTKGPASAQYGNEAMGGTLNIITRQMNTMPRFTIDFFGSQFLEKNLDLGYAKKGKKLSFLSSVNLFDFQNKIDVNRDNFTDIPLLRRASLFTKVFFQRKNQMQSQLAARYYTENRMGGELNWEPKFRGGDSVYGESVQTKRFELLSFHPFFIGKEQFKLQYSFNGHFQDAAYGNNLFIASQHTSFAQLNYLKIFNDKNHFFSGLSLKTVSYDDNTAATAYSSKTIRHTPGLFVQDEIKYNAFHTSLLGFRLEKDQVHGWVFSPRLFHRWNLGSEGEIKFSLGRGFRVVNVFTEDHAALTGARKVVIEKDLQPEKSWNANVQYNGWKNLSSGYLNFDFTLFYSVFSNKIIPNYSLDPNLIVYSNIESKAISRGFAANMDMDFEIPIDLNLGFTIMDVYSMQTDSSGIQKKQWQIQTPNFTGKYQVSYAINKLGLSLDWVGQMIGSMPLPVLPNDFRPSHSPWYGLHHMNVTKKFNSGLEVYAGIKNLANFLPKNPIMRWYDPFDKKVQDSQENPNGYTFDTTYSYAPMQGRKIVVGIRYNLK